MGEHFKIERASMDGSNREVLHDTHLIWPNDLAIDYDRQRLYWTNFNAIEYSDLNGNGRKVLLSFNGTFDLPNFIAISGDYVYWMEYFGTTIYKTHKELPNSDILPVYKNNTIIFFQLGYFKIIDALQQQENSKCLRMCMMTVEVSVSQLFL